MHNAEPIELLPIWGVFLATAMVVLLAIEGGFRLGQYRRRRSELEDRPPVGEMVAATLALLAFMLAFTFGLAASRFDVRRGLVIDEANAIGTTSSRGRLLPGPPRTEVRTVILRASVRRHRREFGIRAGIHLRERIRTPTQVPLAAAHELEETRSRSIAGSSRPMHRRRR